MHDDRKLVERRIERVLRERIRPAVHADPVPLDLTVWHVPGEPVPVAAALAGRVPTGRWPATRGAGLGDDLVPRHRQRCPGAWAGPDGRGGLRPRLRPAPARVPGRGTRVRRRTASRSRGSNPRNTWSRSRSGARPASRSSSSSRPPPTRASSRPGVDAPRRPGDGRATSRSTGSRRADLAVLDEEVWELRPGPRGARRADARARHCDDAAPLGDPARARARRWTCLDLARRRRHGRGGPRARSAAALAQPGPRQRPPDLGGRSRPHRLGLAVAAARDGPQGRPHGRQRHRADGRRPRRSSSRCRRPSSTPGSRSTSPRCSRGCTSAVAAGQFVPVGGMWVESDTNMPGGEALARQFVARQAVLPRRVRHRDRRRCGCPTRSATPRRCPQLVSAGRRRSGSSPRRSPGTRPTSSRTTPSGGRASTAPASSRHFPPVDTYNARALRQRARPRRAQLPEKGRAHPVAGAVRLGRRRRRPDPRDARAGPPRSRDLEGSPRVDVETPGRVLRRGRGRVPRRRRSGSGELYLELHRGTYTTQARTKQGNRRSEHLLREAELWAATAARAPGCRLPVRASWTGSGRRCCCTSSTTSCRARSIAWVHREAEATYAAVADGAGDASSAPRMRGAGRRRGDRPGRVQRRARTTRRGVACPRCGGRPAERLAEQPVAVTVRESSRRRVRSSTTAWSGSTSTARPADLGASTWRPAARCSPPGARGNLLQLHPDLPNDWDAWDIDALLPQPAAPT